MSIKINSAIKQTNVPIKVNLQIENDLSNCNNWIFKKIRTVKINVIIKSPTLIDSYLLGLCPKKCTPSPAIKRPANKRPQYLIINFFKSYCISE